MVGALNERVHEGFRATFGRDPEGTWSAPGRVSVAGDHTDLQDGLSFGFAIADRTAVAIARRDDDEITIATDLTEERASGNLATLQPGEGMDDWKAYPLGMIWSVVEHARAEAERAAGDVDELADRADPSAVGTGLDIFLSSDLTIGGGLASSASVCAAMGLALSDLWQLKTTPLTLAHLGHRTEVHAAGATSGIADQITVLTAKAGHDVFFDARGRDVSLIRMPDLDAADLVTLAVRTNETHRNWSAPFRERQEACARVATALGKQSLREVHIEELDERAGELDATDLRRARYIVTEIQRTLDLTRILRTEGPAHVGPTLRASQSSLRDDYEVSTERLDATCDLADHHGAIGARMIGTGLGGSVFVLISSAAAEDFGAACRDLYRERGWDEPAVTQVVACDGARRDA